MSRLTNTLRQAFVAAVMQDVPQRNYSEEAREAAQAAVAKTLPPEVRAIWNNPQLRGYVATFQLSLGEAMYVQLPGSWNEDSKQVAKTATRDLVKAAIDQRVKLDALRQKLNAVANAHTTVEGLKKALPECTKYLPSIPPSPKSLPAIATLVSDLTACGWPKDAAKNRAKKGGAK